METKILFIGVTLILVFVLFTSTGSNLLKSLVGYTTSNTASVPDANKSVGGSSDTTNGKTTNPYFPPDVNKGTVIG